MNMLSYVSVTLLVNMQQSLCAIITPNLVSPVICGLPFLSHNSIVVDHAACTVIDKVQCFDLINPTIQTLPPIPKKRLNENFTDLNGDRKVMVAELNMGFNDHLNMLR